MDERRQFVRVPVQAEVECAALPDGVNQTIRAKDLSAGGACVVTEDPLPADAQLQVAIQLPDQPPVNAIAEPVWTATTEVTGKGHTECRVETGLRFTEISPTDHNALISYVAKSLRVLTL